MTDIPIDKQISCVRREIGMRRRVYPRWIAQGKMEQEKADRQIFEMESVLATLERVRLEQETKTNPSLGI